MAFEDPHHIIAIGASAGDPEEINLFFDHYAIRRCCLRHHTARHNGINKRTAGARQMKVNWGRVVNLC